MMLALDALQRLLQSFDKISARRTFDDGEPVLQDLIGMGLSLNVRQHVALPRMTLCRVLGAG